MDNERNHHIHNIIKGIYYVLAMQVYQKFCLLPCHNVLR